MRNLILTAVLVVILACCGFICYQMVKHDDHAEAALATVAEDRGENGVLMEGGFICKHAYPETRYSKGDVVDIVVVLGYKKPFCIVR